VDKGNGLKCLEGKELEEYKEYSKIAEAFKVLEGKRIKMLYASAQGPQIWVYTDDKVIEIKPNRKKQDIREQTDLNGIPFSKKEKPSNNLVLKNFEKIKLSAKSYLEHEISYYNFRLNKLKREKQHIENGNFDATLDVCEYTEGWWKLIVYAGDEYAGDWYVDKKTFEERRLP
jgi:hypothetical protein